MNSIYCFTFTFLFLALALAIDAREDGCVDNIWWNCPKAVKYASCDKESMKRNCPVTCDSCDYCVDMIGSYRCGRQNKNGKFCKSKYASACRKTCGICGGEEAEVVDGGWGEWSDFGKCSASCGGGTEKRTRSCNNPEPENGGKDCEGDAVESNECGTEDCATCQDNQWWKCDIAVKFAGCEKESMRRNCPVTCNSCDYCVDMFGGRACERAISKMDYCSYKGAKYAYTCRKTCGVCEGSGSEEIESVDGGWTEWSDFDECTATCGGGESKRHRSCTNPEPQGEGKDCEGEAVETNVCGTDPCPVDGGWGKYSSWTACSKTCDAGEVSRARECDSPAPANGGKDCEGDSSQTVPCFVRPCDDKEDFDSK